MGLFNLPGARQAFDVPEGAGRERAFLAFEAVVAVVAQHQRIVAERDTGTAVLIISSELDEIYALADRIAVMYRGRIVGTVPADTARDALGLMMAGTPAEQALDPQEQTR